MNIKTSTPQNSGSALRAFTLVEVMVSVAILAIMVVAIYPAFILGFASIKTTREEERATQIMTQKLESIRLCTWDELATYPSTFIDYYNPGSATGSRGALYAGTITIANANTVIPNTASYQSKMQLITIGVTWTNYVNSSPVVHNRQMQTLSAYWGLQNYIWGNNP